MAEPTGFSSRFLWIFGGLLGTLFLLGALAETYFPEARADLQTLRVPISNLGISRLRERLVRLGVFSVVPNSRADFISEGVTPDVAQNELPNSGSGRGAHAYSSAKAVLPENFPSSAIALDPAFAQIPTLSLSLDAYDLRGGRKALFDNIDGRGRKWERGGFVSFFSEGQMRFASPVGVRIHGGTSRHMPGPQSFRLKFRPEYGISFIPPGAIFPAEVGGLNEFVVHNDRRLTPSRSRATHLLNPLGYDLVRKMGGYAPRTVPARFYLNGKYAGLYVLTERLDVEYFKKFFGHDQFTLLKERDESSSNGFVHGEREELEKFRRWASSEDHSWALDEVGKVIDIEQFTYSMMMAFYCGNSDPWQAVIVKEHRRYDGKWIWFNWDLDHCFIDFYQSKKNGWEQPTLKHLLVGTKAAKRRLSYQIFRRLMYRREPDYREYFAKTLARVLTEQLTPEFLNERAAYYEKILNDYDGVSGKRYQLTVREFFEKRPEVVLNRVQAFLEEHAR